MISKVSRLAEGDRKVWHDQACQSFSQPGLLTHLLKNWTQIILWVCELVRFISAWFPKTMEGSKLRLNRNNQCLKPILMDIYMENSFINLLSNSKVSDLSWHENTNVFNYPARYFLLPAYKLYLAHLHQPTLYHYPAIYHSRLIQKSKNL